MDCARYTCKTIKGGTHRLGELGNIAPVGEHVSAVGLGVSLGGHLLDVGTSGKGLLGSGQNDGSNVVVEVKLLAGGNNLVDEIIAQGVEGLRSVEGDNADVSLDLGEDVLVRSGTVETLLVSESLAQRARYDKRALHDRYTRVR